ncbi:transcription-repair coupling factor [Heliobacterium undosum]|uniref:Transcription-repair-coupling factor n=1 Tax=Heliomicrobium undosum TaxID=121734 RepID=A0A845KZ58_9FIRM|nr:transcription-repair coupling factor [Heliomicrobium undosum]MZP29297.1 transcription-repair coupling factor [Heliomicrobium undosum]
MAEKAPVGNLFEYIAQTTEFQHLWSNWKRGRRQQAVFGLAASQRTALMATMARRSGHPLCVVTHSIQQARRIAEDLQALLPDEEVLSFPATEVMPYEVLTSSHELLAQRLEVLSRLARREPVTVVTTIDALMKKLVPPAVMAEGDLEFAVGSRVELGHIQERLHYLGYQRTPMVEAPGQYSLRGGILDVYPLTQSLPARIEFFDDEIDSIRLFDLETQRSKEKQDRYAVGPAREMLLATETLAQGRRELEKEAAAARERLLKSGCQEAAARLQAKIDSYLEQLDEGIWVEGLEQFQNFFYPDQVTLFGYLHPETIVFWDEPTRLKESAEAKEQEISETFVHLLEAGSALPVQRSVYVHYSDLAGELAGHMVIHLALLAKKIERVTVEDTIQFSAKNMHPFLGKLDMLAEELKNYKKRRMAVLILAASTVRRDRIRDALRDYGVEAQSVPGIDAELHPGTVAVGVGQLEAGFELVQARLALITDFEIFGREKRPRKPRKSAREGQKIDTFVDLALGDYVVHVNHGIGRYMGVEKLDVGGVHKDYLVIRYAGEDRLYVPTDQVHLIQKYVGAEGVAPKLYRLGGNEWHKVKQKVKDSVRELAGDLLKLYAARESKPGFAYTPDTLWQKEFEEAFPYEETPDQVRSIAEVKTDMEKAKAMDRLLCGDVGYGKTEVAIRAAFKAVQDGKQVAILVPTTILAQQHYNTFRERFSGYPVRVDVLSRFRSPKEQKVSLEGLKSGEVDIVIGTHRLVSNDVAFKELGLLIIDEEQRFGVAHKEKIKHLKENVDVLTLSATPIPRTLHMSLVGLRDMSIIETPPEDRYPVQTYVVEYNPELIREAVRRELNRGGQVYYVRNRIEDLDRIARDLGALVPDARIVVGHGKMREDQLEQVMLDFLEGEYDILVCTTIIETGLDIPNVNTLIVDGADLMGLSQLYQLRGRVGRSNRLAYAFFTYRKDKVLTEVAEKRLHAIREFTELGSGFKIAMRDLEIRGVGNLLGPEQHGQMASVGFDLYCRLLEEAIQELKGAKPEEAPETFVEIRVDAFIPDDYMADSSSKVQFYKRLLAARTVDQVEALEEEMEDRFGDLPEPVENLVRLSRIKAYGQQAGVSAVQQEKEELRIRFFPHAKVEAKAISALVQHLGRKVNFSATGGFEIRIKPGRVKPRELLRLLDHSLGIIAGGGQSGEGNGEAGGQGAPDGKSAVDGKAAAHGKSAGEDAGARAGARAAFGAVTGPRSAGAQTAKWPPMGRK